MTEEIFNRIEYEKLAVMQRAYGWERTVYRSRNCTPALYKLVDVKGTAEKVHYQLSSGGKMHEKKEIMQKTVKVYGKNII